MRIKLSVFQAPPGRLLSLLLILTLVRLAASAVHSKPSFLHQDISGISTLGRALVGGTPLIKSYRLYSRCSGTFVRMYFHKIIDASTTEKDAYFTWLNFVSVGNGSIRIKANATKKFLCFSRNGKLISRSNGRSQQCKFKEESHHNYIKLRSVADDRWYVGFNRKGRKLNGWAANKKQKLYDKHDRCFMFTKVSQEESDSLRKRSRLDILDTAALDKSYLTHR